MEPRATCARCWRPAAFCWCPHLTTIETKTRVVLLQHPRERDVAIGTARMATLCLPNSELYVGVSWGDSPALARALSDPARPAALLYPGDGAIDVDAHPPPGPITLVVVDGTWTQARKLVKTNPALAALPRYSFTPAVPSQYRIRKEPHESFVSTIEALVYVLGALEGDREKMRAMLTPFRAMIDAQIACEETLQGGRTRYRRTRAPKPRAPSPLEGRLDDVVCVIADANAWPRDEGTGVAPHPDELVQWIAHRPSTGETLELVVAPRNPLAPATVRQTGLDAGLLAGGASVAELLERWRRFARPTDLVCSWGEYGVELFAAAGGVLPEVRVDLRQLARSLSDGRPGTSAEFLARRGRGGPFAALGRGRAGARLAEIAEVARLLSAPPPRP